MPVESGEPSGTFFGRAVELQGLREQVARVCDGRGRLVAVFGDAGIGKTRLVEEAILHSGLPADRVLVGRCLEQAGAPSYWPWTRALRSRAARAAIEAVRSELEPDAALLAPLLPGLLPGGPQPKPASGIDDLEVRYHLFTALLGLLRRMAADRPLVLVLEDVHWADEASLALLEFIAPELDETQLLLLITYRDRERPRLPRPLVEAVRRAHRVHVTGLDRNAVGALVSQAAGSIALPELTRRIEELTAGNPFFIGEVLRTLAQEGRLAPARQSEPFTLPDTVRDSVRRHLDLLASEERELLALAAVGGDDLDLALLQLAAQAEAKTVLEWLAGPVERGLIAQQPSGRFRFAHAIVRETIYGDLLPAARVQMHARIGEAMESLYGQSPTPPLGALASHFLYAAPLGTAPKAAAYATRAAEQAIALYAFHDALEAYEQALAAVGVSATDRAQRLALRIAAADVARRGGHDVRARELFRLAAQDARALGDRTALFLAAVGYYQVSPNIAEPDAETVPLLEEALASVPQGDNAMRAILLALLGAARSTSEGPARGEAPSAEAIEMARRLGDPGTLATTLLARQLVVTGPGSTNQRVALADEVLALVERGARGVESLARGARVHCFLELGEIAQAAAELERMASATDRVREPLRLWQVNLRRATIALLEGRFEDGVRLAAEALTSRRSGSDPMAFQAFVLQMFLARRDTVEHGGLEGSLRWIVERHPDNKMWACVQAVLFADLGREAEARAAYESIVADGLARLEALPNYSPMLAWLARLCMFTRDTARAPELYERLLPYADQNIVLGPNSQACLGSAHRYLGILAMTLGELDDAERHLAAAIAMNERMAARPVVACCQHELARALEQRSRPGDRLRGRELLSAARATAKDCGLVQLLGWIKFLGPIPLDDEATGQPPAEVPDRSGDLRPAAEPKAPGPTPEPAASAVFRLDGDIWLVGYAGETRRMKDAKGAHLLATLLRHPGQEIHALELDGGNLGAMSAPADVSAAPIDRGDAGALLDGAARDAYRRRLEDLRDELDEAERFGDPARAARTQQEIDFLADELARGVGLGGRERRAASSAERARVNATRTIGKVVKRIEELSPRLGAHLRSTVRTGYVCVYAPDPANAIRWEL